MTEPFAIPQKFPNAFIHAHYARAARWRKRSTKRSMDRTKCSSSAIRSAGRGRSSAESVAGLEVGAKVQGVLQLTPSATVPDGANVARYELYSDGNLYDDCEAGEAQRSRSIPAVWPRDITSCG